MIGCPHETQILLAKFPSKDGEPVITFYIYSGVYGLGCFFTMAFFFLGRIPVLNERNWPWLVIFLWPMLVLWPVHALAGLFIKRASRKSK